MTKIIPLTQGQFAKVDDEDYEYLMQWKWCAYYHHSTKSYYAWRGVWNGKNNDHVRMHRVIMNTPDNLVVDHINHDTLDNRKENLRNVTQAQNCMNRGANINNKLGAKGVRKRGSKFYASISFGGKQTHLGRFDTVIEASSAYQEAFDRLVNL